MSAFSEFLNQLRLILPEYRAWLDNLAEKHDGDHLAVIAAIKDRMILPHARLCQLWGDSLGVAYVNPFNVELPNDQAHQLPAEIVRAAQAIVLNYIDGTATVAMTNPRDERLRASLRKILGMEVSPVFAHPDEITAITELQFGAASNLEVSLQRACEEIPTVDSGREINSVQDIADLIAGQAFVELFNSVLLTAFKRRASDIHLEATPAGGRVRMRIDGDMTDVLRVPTLVHEALLVRIKVLANLDVAESRLPQDGAFEIQFAGKCPAFRASTMPSLYGQKAVLRLLGGLGEKSAPRLGSLGLADSTRHGLRRAILRPNGIILVCGPTGSGKTTTLYSCLQEIDRPDLNIVTIEDPIEIRVPSFCQHQVNHQIDLDFSRILRGILRQDPDVVLIGEIRDTETATIAAEAALTGHLVLSSVHTNDSLQAITRLVELGVERHLIAPTVVGVLSQRLVRRICPGCKESYVPSHDELAPYFVDPGAVPVRLYRGRGCPRCYGTGFVGRVGVYEMLEISEEMRELILRGAGQAELLAEARHTGFQCMRYDALKKALLGWTTLEEVERNTIPEINHRAAA